MAEQSAEFPTFEEPEAKITEEKGEELVTEVEERHRLSDTEKIALIQLSKKTAHLQEATGKLAIEIAPEILSRVKADPEKFVYKPKWDISFQEPSSEKRKTEMPSESTKDDLEARNQQITVQIQEASSVLATVKDNKLKRVELINQLLARLSENPPYNIEELGEEGMSSFVKRHLLEILGTATLSRDVEEVTTQIKENLKARASETLTRVERFVSSLQSPDELIAQEKVIHNMGRMLWEMSWIDHEKANVLPYQQVERIIMLTFPLDLLIAKSRFELKGFGSPLREVLHQVQENPFVTVHSRKLREQFESQTYLKRGLAKKRFPEIETAIILSGSANVGVAGPESDIDVLSYLHNPDGGEIPSWFFTKTAKQQKDFSGEQESVPITIRSIIQAIESYKFDGQTPSLNPEAYYQTIKPEEGIPEVNIDIYTVSLFNWAGYIQETEGTLNKFRKMTLQAIAQHPQGEFIWEKIIAKNWQRLNVLYEENITAGKKRAPKVKLALRAELKKRMGDVSEKKLARAEHLITELRERTRLPSLREICRAYGVELG